MTDRILFLGTSFDRNYLAYLKGCVGSATVAVSYGSVRTKTELQLFCEKNKIKHVLTTQIPLLEKLLNWEVKKKPSLSDYAGSYFTIGEIEIVFIPPLQQLVTVPYGKFLTRRFVHKFTKPQQWWKPTPFEWTILTQDKVDRYLELFSKASYIAVDIETFKHNAAIRCISYTAFHGLRSPQGKLKTLGSRTIVIPMNDMWGVYAMRKFNALPAPKILQNGKYDIAYMTRYGAPLINYKWDTAALFHSWYSELPKDLGFLNAFMLREATYWKDLSGTSDLEEFYRYNGLDTWGTGNVFFALMAELPEYALDNYLLEFPIQIPCHLCEMIGIKRDPDRLEKARREQQTIIDANTASLNKMLGLTNFNTNSVPQVKSLLHILGCKDLKSTNEASLEKARYRHPLNARILQHIIDNRKARKLMSTYLTVGTKAKEYKGRILYALNPHGTDTSRLASVEHHFWCGFNIQNQKRGSEVKQTYVADEGFMFAEVDLAQAETWDTAYISGDGALLAAVNSPKDFHAGNVERFFAIPYVKVYDDKLKKVLDKEIRDLGKRVNHGANYNMGPMVMVDTMGLKKVFYAKRILKLPKFYTAKQVCEYLLEDCFHVAYPDIRKVYHAGILEEVKTTGMIRTRAIHYPIVIKTDMGLERILTLDVEQHFDDIWNTTAVWTRRCFGDPDKSKHIRNSYIAHGPQSLNAQTLNKAFLRVFNDIAINPKYSPHFKLCAQIHDSILFQFRIGHEYLCEMVRERMEIPVVIKGYDNVVRTFTVPADIKAGPEGKGAKYWSDTE